MGQLVTKLNLNKTPQEVENNSLIFAKNIKLRKDGTITKDDGISEKFGGEQLNYLANKTISNKLAELSNIINKDDSTLNIINAFFSKYFDGSDLSNTTNITVNNFKILNSNANNTKQFLFIGEFTRCLIELDKNSRTVDEVIVTPNDFSNDITDAIKDYCISVVNSCYNVGGVIEGDGSYDKPFFGTRITSSYNDDISYTTYNYNNDLIKHKYNYDNLNDFISDIKDKISSKYFDERGNIKIPYLSKKDIFNLKDIFTKLATTKRINNSVIDGWDEVNKYSEALNKLANYYATFEQIMTLYKNNKGTNYENYIADYTIENNVEYIHTYQNKGITYYYYDMYYIFYILNWYVINVDSLINIIKDYTDTVSITDYESIIKQYQDYLFYFSILRTAEDGNKYAERFKIIDVISYNNEFYIFYRYKFNNKTEYFIIKYDERLNEYNICNTNWSPTNNDVDDIKLIGNVIYNLRGDTLLTIGEYSKSGKNIFAPLKTINLNESSHSDNESIYTQIQQIPIINLIYIGKYTNSIPRGTYQFFIRYEIKENYYTSWFPCSPECFTAKVRRKNKTLIGSLKYVESVGEASESFVFNVEVLRMIEGYKSFQLGFLLSNDDTTVARAWKKFSFDTQTIYFEYNSEQMEELDITDLTSPVFGLYDVKNITSFKHKQYLSNYTETDFNPSLQVFADNIHIDIVTDTENSSTFIATSEYRINNYYYSKINDISIKQIIENIIETIINEFDTIQSDDIISKNGIDFKVHSINTNLEDSTIGVTGTSVGKLEWNPYTINNKVAITKENDRYLFNLSDRDFYNLYDKESKKFIYDSGTNAAEGEIRIYIRDFKKEIIFKIALNDKVTPSWYTNKDISSLLPFQKYKFYVHYVTDKGEITNGYLIKNENEESYFTVDVVKNESNIENHYVIYPKFTGIVYPDGYVACFFSILHYDTNVFELFKSDNVKYDSIELDTELYIIGEFAYKYVYNNTIKNSTDTTLHAKYYPSYDSSNYLYFGNVGTVDINDTNINNVSFIFGELQYTNNDKNAQLIKCTPFINTSSYSDFSQMNLLGYICDVIKPKIGRGDNGRYVSDGVLYSIDSSWQLQNLNIYYGESESKRIYSNFNLNYLSLSEDGKTVLTIKTGSDGKTTNIIEYVNSENLSHVYELQSMYRDYIRRTYSIYDKDAVHKFDNIIRSSKVVGDEDKVYINEFLPGDYYPVPTNKGKIVNLIGAGDILLVHTNDSMFRFTGANTFSTTGGEDVTTLESNIFDTGITEIFGSEKGYAGLQNKECSILTPIGYMFYDHDSNMIYNYNGQSNISIISDTIDKLLKQDTIDIIYFAYDYLNNRIFVNIKFIHNGFVTLSYNTNDNGWISFHNFDYSKTFNTKTRCYFIKDNCIYTIDSSKNNYGALASNDVLYPSYKMQNGTDTCVIDILYNYNYEAIKVLNSISWINSKIEKFSDNYNVITITNKSENDLKYFANENENVNLNHLVAEEGINTVYAGERLEIYTDNCYTPLLDISQRANDKEINTKGYSLFPIFNKGVWSMNYFRDIKNIQNEFNYKDTNTDKAYKGQQNYILSDNRSLIYGKYIVARFIFKRTDNFKFENVMFNVSNY